MTTRKVETRFMRGNIDVDGCIFDLLVERYGMSEVCSSIISFDEAIYSDGFICAVESGKTPGLEVIEDFKKNTSREYHHVIYNDECYVMYFD